MTNTNFTDAVDTVGIICAAVAVFAQDEPQAKLFFLITAGCLILSSSVRLANEKRIATYLAGIRDKVKR